MWGRNIKWCVGIILAVALTIAVTMTLQNWQRSHFISAYCDSIAVHGSSIPAVRRRCFVSVKPLRLHSV